MTPRTLLIAAALCILFAFIAMQRVRAQAHVESKSFDVMLSTLLTHSVPEIEVSKAAADTNAIYLDAREWPEYQVSHIPDAIWVGYDDFQLSRLGAIAKDTPIVVYCSVGYRSEKVTEKLRQAGYTHVSNLYGGIFEWVNRDQQVVNPEKAITNKVHAYSKSWGIWLEKGEKVYQ